MHTRLGRRPVVTLLAGLTVVGSATAVYAISLEPDGTHLRTDWTNGGEVWLELEDRNALPALCFVWRNDLPDDGDSVASRILTVGGQPYLDLGTGDQWLEGMTSGCEVIRDTRYRDVFANPGRYVVEMRVVADQGTPATGPVRSKPLMKADG